YKEGVNKVLLEFSETATFDVKRNGFPMITVQVNQRALATWFATAMLGRSLKLAGLEGLSNEQVDILVNTPPFQKLLVEAMGLANFMVRYMPKLHERLFDLLTVASIEKMAHKQLEEKGQPYKLKSNLHEKVLELEKEIRRATKTQKTGPKPTWTKQELQQAVESAVEELVKERKNRRPTIEKAANIINRDHPDKPPFTKETLAKRLERLKIDWKAISRSEKRHIK